MLLLSFRLYPYHRTALDATTITRVPPFTREACDEIWDRAMRLKLLETEEERPDGARRVVVACVGCADAEGGMGTERLRAVVEKAEEGTRELRANYERVREVVAEMNMTGTQQGDAVAQRMQRAEAAVARRALEEDAAVAAAAAQREAHREAVAAQSIAAQAERVDILTTF